MYIHSKIESSSLTVAAGPGAPHQQPRADAHQRRRPFWAFTGLASLAAACFLAQAWSVDSTPMYELEAFQHRVVADADDASVESPASVLARRYLGALQPEVRQHISDQVREEQRAGTTAPGKSAFVLRRLELYEAALQQSRTVAASQAL